MQLPGHSSFLVLQNIALPCPTPHAPAPFLRTHAPPYVYAPTLPMSSAAAFSAATPYPCGFIGTSKRPCDPIWMSTVKAAVSCQRRAAWALLYMLTRGNTKMHWCPGAGIIGMCPGAGVLASLACVQVRGCWHHWHVQCADLVLSSGNWRLALSTVVPLAKMDKNSASSSIDSYGKPPNV